MTQQDDLRLAILGILQSVPNIGNVYPHYKYSSNLKDFLGQFSWNDENGLTQYRGGWINIPTVRTGPTTTFDQPEDLYTWPVRLLMTLSDRYNSEERFENLVYLARKTIQQHLTLGLPSVEVIPGTVVVNIPTIDIRRFGSALVHFCEMSIDVEVNVTDMVFVP